VQVEDAGFVAEVRLQDPRCAHGFRNHGTAGDDAEIFAFVAVFGFEFGFEGIDEVSRLVAQANYVGLAEDEWRLLVGDDRRRFAGEANVLWPNVFEQQDSR
jgi:hypothetical protein